MSAHSDRDRALAFAGMLQALQLVQSTAYGRPCDVATLQASLNSILLLDADSVENIYGGVRGVASGLRLVKTQLGTGSSVPDREISRYLVTLLHLERKLSNRSDLLDTLRAGIERAQAQAEHFEITHGNLIASLADTYSQTISTLSPRIMVNGDASRLREPATADRIRALLLAAMRSAVLWRQCGGTRIGLLFSRGKLVANADRLLG
jgi:high frequency lysogenization protein